MGGEERSNVSTASVLKAGCSRMESVSEPAEAEGTDTPPVEPPTITPVELTESLVLEYAGEDNTCDVNMLLARNANIASLDGLAGMQLPNLQVISLSNNSIGPAISGLAGVAAGLTSLNLNNNAIEDISPLHCCGHLESLFLACNRVRDISMLEACVRLKELNVFGNLLPDLHQVLGPLASCPELRDLDIASNPCSFEDGCRYQVLASLPFLSLLDQEPITVFDEQMASESHSVEQKFGGQLDSIDELQPTEQEDANNCSTTTQLVGESGQLNDHPVMLEYLAQSTIESAELTLQPPKPKTPSSSSFVSKIRRASAADEAIRPGTAQRIEAVLQPHSGWRPGTSSGAPSQPETIRRLLKLVESLQGKVNTLQMQAECAVTPEAEEELRLLRLENANMHHLRNENDSLKEQMAEMQAALTAAGSTIGKKFAVIPGIGSGIPLGTDVEGDFGGEGEWYNGKIMFDHGNGTFDIVYDDGDIESGVSRNKIRLRLPGSASAGAARSYEESPDLYEPAEGELSDLGLSILAGDDDGTRVSTPPSGV